MTDEEQLALNAVLVQALGKYLDEHPEISQISASATLIDIAVLFAMQHGGALGHVIRRVHTAWAHYTAPATDIPSTEN